MKTPTTNISFRTTAALFLGLCMLAVPRTGHCLETLKPGEKLTLQRAIQLTLRNHPRGMQMESEAIAADARVGEARSALMPQVYGASEYLRSTDNPIGNTTYLNPGFVPRITGTLHGGRPGEGQSFSTTDNFLGAVGVQQYLFDFGRVRGQIEQREAEAGAAQAATRQTDLDLVFEATQRYFALLAAGQKVKVYQKAIDQRSEELHAAKVRAGAGLTSQIDVLTAQSELARAKTGLLDSSNQEATARVALNNAMALSTNAPDYELADMLTYKEVAGDLGSYFTTAIRLRPDLKELEQQARAAGAQVTQAQSDFYPAIAAEAGYNTMGTGLPAANNFNAGIVVTWPIFNGFLTQSQIHEAKARQDSIRYAMQDLQLRIWLEVKSAFLDLQTALQRIHESEETLAASAGQLELAEKRYSAGLGNIIELTDAERFYIQDNAGYVDALYGFSIAKAWLDQTTGVALAKVADR
ncbi:MAG TPA: TolC family protein [Candidatus Binataceae bacterium]|nr:TolC family protein [Candidatus Binataceae bacterium]